jgi:hypothetical protein
MFCADSGLISERVLQESKKQGYPPTKNQAAGLSPYKGKASWKEASSLSDNSKIVIRK